MSPTQYAVKRAQLDEEADAARSVGDLVWLQTVMQQLTMLNHAYYGQPRWDLNLLTRRASVKAADSAPVIAAASRPLASRTMKLSVCSSEWRRLPNSSRGRI